MNESNLIHVMPDTSEIMIRGTPNSTTDYHRLYLKRVSLGDTESTISDEMQNAIKSSIQPDEKGQYHFVFNVCLDDFGGRVQEPYQAYRFYQDILRHFPESTYTFQGRNALHQNYSDIPLNKYPNLYLVKTFKHLENIQRNFLNLVEKSGFNNSIMIVNGNKIQQSSTLFLLIEACLLRKMEKEDTQYKRRIYEGSCKLAGFLSFVEPYDAQQTILLANLIQNNTLLNYFCDLIRFNEIESMMENLFSAVFVTNKINTMSGLRRMNLHLEKILASYDQNKKTLPEIQIDLG